MKTIGVDLGTTNSCVYYLDEEDHPVLITDRLGRKIFPSVVWCAGPGKEIVVGSAAKTRLGQQPSPVVAVKRKIGTTETVVLGGEPVSAITVSAHILSYLKALVEETTGDQVGAAVVTVPAYFDAAPRKDTYTAAVEALFGGDVARAKGQLELQLEPEAAAFAYTLEDPAEHLRILAYDLGGGTFDVTVLEKSSAAGLTSLKFGGDPHLGGDNVDDRIAIWFLYLLRGGRTDALDRILGSDRYPEDTQYTILQQLLINDTVALRGELRPEDRELLAEASPRYVLAVDAAQPESLARVQKLKGLAEKAKMDLTTSTVITVTHQNLFLDDVGEPVDVDLSIDRATFNRLIGDFVGRTLEETSRVLAASGLTAEQIDRIILVGGSTRMPIIREELEKRFSCPILEADPDLIVARGAVLKARQLSPAMMAGSAGEKLRLEFPRKTSEERTQIKGLVAQPSMEFTAYLSRDGGDLAEVEIEGDRFLFERVPLLLNTPNALHVEVAGPNGELFAEADFTIVHDERAVADRLESPLTKDIQVQGMRGFKTILREGDSLPAHATIECFRGTSDDCIIIPLFEGERWLTNLVVTGVDPSLPEGAAIDLQVTVNSDFTCSATATVRTTRQAASVDFEITRIEIPAVEELDRQLDDALEELDNDLKEVHNRDRRAGFARRARRIEADYRKARGELTCDKHHLYSMVGELSKLLIDVRGAYDLLTPPREELEELLRTIRGIARHLDGQGQISKEEALSKADSLESSGKDAWEREDAEHWKSVHAELVKLHQAILPPPPPPPPLTPERLHAGLLAWLGSLREKVEEAGLESRFVADLDEVERSVRKVDLRSRDNARETLLGFIDRLNPLDARIDRAIREQTGKPASTTGTTNPNIYF
jgi:actin-like ATPase involved in cell morphogenesis